MKNWVAFLLIAIGTGCGKKQGLIIADKDYKPPTQCGPTIAAYTGTFDRVREQLESCPPHTYVQLGQGEFHFEYSNGRNMWPSKADIELRGAGIHKTLAHWDLVYTVQYYGGPQ